MTKGTYRIHLVLNLTFICVFPFIRMKLFTFEILQSVIHANKRIDSILLFTIRYYNTMRVSYSFYFNYMFIYMIYECMLKGSVFIDFRETYFYRIVLIGSIFYYWTISKKKNTLMFINDYNQIKSCSYYTWWSTNRTHFLYLITI